MVYWSRINDSLLTFTKYPRIKYTPFSIWNTDPVADAPTDIVVAKGTPASITEFPNNPDVIIWLQINASPSVNVWVALSLVDDLSYDTYKVTFPLSESADDKTLSTVAVTPDVWPVIVVPISWSVYASTGTPWNVFVSCTA